MSSSWLSVSQIANLLEVNPKSIDYLINQGKIKFIRPGKRKRLINQMEYIRLKKAKETGLLLQTANKKFQDQQNVILNDAVNNYPRLIDIANKYRIKYSVFWRELKKNNFKTIKFNNKLYLNHEEIKKLEQMIDENKIFRRARHTLPDQENSDKKLQTENSYTIKTAAKILKVNPRTLQFYCVNQTINTFMYCGQHHINKNELSQLQQAISQGQFLSRSNQNHQDATNTNLINHYRNYLTLNQLAGKLNLNPATLYNYHYRHLIPGTIFQGKLIFSPEQHHRIQQLIDQEIILINTVNRQKINQINKLAKTTILSPTDLDPIIILPIDQLSPTQFCTIILAAKAGNQSAFEYILKQSTRIIKYWAGHFASRFSTTFSEALHFAHIGVFIAIKNYHKFDLDFIKFLKKNIIWSIKRESYREFCGQIINFLPANTDQ